MLVVAVVFANSLGNKFVYDDKGFVVDNSAIRSLANIPSFFTSIKSFNSAGNFYVYRPLAVLSFALDYSLAKLNPLVFHLSSVVWHAAVSLMLYFLLNLILEDERRALFATLLFSLHPVQVESVAWVTQRSNLISLFFFLLAFYMWIKNSSMGSLVCFSLALLGKEMAITLPMIIILYDMCRGSDLRKRAKYYIPFFIADIIYLILRTAVLGRIGGQDAWAGGSAYAAGLTALKAALFYVRLLLLPVNLCAAYHDFSPAVSLSEPGMLGSCAFIIAVLSIGVLLLREKRKESFFILWFFVTLFPVSNIVPLQQVIVAERFLYFPSIGFCVLLSLMVFSLSKKTGCCLCDTHAYPLRFAFRKPERRLEGRHGVMGGEP